MRAVRLGEFQDLTPVPEAMYTTGLTSCFMCRCTLPSGGGDQWLCEDCWESARQGLLWAYIRRKNFERKQKDKSRQSSEVKANGVLG